MPGNGGDMPIIEYAIDDMVDVYCSRKRGRDGKWMYACHYGLEAWHFRVSREHNDRYWAKRNSQV